MRRDEKGKVIEGIFARFKNWKMGRQMKAGKIPRGRTVPGLSQSEIQRNLLLQFETEIVRAWNTGKRDQELATQYDVKLGNMQAFIRYLSKFSITPGCIRKIPLNPPLQKGEEVGMPGFIEKLHI